MRRLALHARSRGLPAAGALALVVTLLAWAGAEALADSPRYGVAYRWPVALSAALLLAVVVGPTLSGADPELEATAALPWRRWRLVHVAGATAVAAGMLAATGLREPTTYGSAELVRNVAGFLGLVLATAVVLGSRLAWTLAAGFGVLASAHGPPSSGSDPFWALAGRRVSYGESGV